MIFKVKRYFEVQDEIIVHADSAQEAEEKSWQLAMSWPNDVELTGSTTTLVSEAEAEEIEANKRKLNRGE